MKHKQLFCFTYAGGNASFFDIIEEDLPEIDVVKLEYAGHGNRHKEPFYPGFDALADDLYSQIKTESNGSEYGLFGYSMGAISLVEVLIRILDEGSINRPTQVFLAAHEPHTKTELRGYSEEELDEYVRLRTIQFGAIPEKLINNKSFWRMYIPLFRSDYSLISKYSFEELDLKTDIPASVFYSNTDTPISEMKKWEEYFTGTCDFFQFEGSHFFIQQHHETIAKIISNKMRIIQ